MWKEWIECKRVFLLVLHGFIRVIRRLRHIVWPVLCRFERQGFEKIPEALCTLVLQFLEGKLEYLTEVEKATPSLLQSHSSQSVLLCLKYESTITLFQPSFSKPYANFTDHPI